MINVYIENTPIIEFLQKSTKPTILLIIAEGCEHRKGKLQTEFEEKINAYTEVVNYYAICIPQEHMEFPYLATQLVYYFAAQDSNPLFTRTGAESINSLDVDVQTILKMMEGMLYEEAAFGGDVSDQIQNCDYTLKTESLEKFPSSFQQLRNFAAEVWTMAKRSTRGLPIVTDANTAYNRILTCESCEFYKNSRCTKCGCFMNVKVNFQQATCPENKW